MGAVADAVSSVVDTVGDAVSSVGNVVEDVGQAVVDNVVEPVVNAVDNTVQAAIDDPVGTAVKVAAVASGNPLLVAAANTAVAVANGADLDDALESGAKAGAIAMAAQGVANYVNAPDIGGVTGPDNIDVGGGFNPATGAAASAAAPSPVVGNIAGSATANVLRGQDPLDALINGGISAGTSSVTSQIEGFKDLPPAAQKAVNKAVATALQGGDPSMSLVNSALNAGIAEAKAQYNAAQTKTAEADTTDPVMSQIVQAFEDAQKQTPTDMGTDVAGPASLAGALPAKVFASEAGMPLSGETALEQYQSENGDWVKPIVGKKADGTEYAYEIVFDPSDQSLRYSYGGLNDPDNPDEMTIVNSKNRPDFAQGDTQVGVATPESDLVEQEAEKIAELSDEGFVTPEKALSMMKELEQFLPEPTVVDVPEKTAAPLPEPAPTVPAATPTEQELQNYDALNIEQKKIANDLIAQGKASADAIAEAKATFATDISGVKTDVSGVKTDVSNLSDTVKANYDSLTAGQKKIADDLIQQGVDVSKAISEVQSGLSGQISANQQATQSALEGLSAAQQKEVADRIQMGQDINSAIGDVKSGLTGVETSLSNQLAAQAAAQAAADKAILDRMAADKAAAEEKAAADAKAAENARVAAAAKLEADRIAAQKVNLGKSAQSILAGGSGTSTAGALATAASMAPTFLTSKVTQDKFQDPLASLRRLQSEPLANENTSQLAPQPESLKPMSDPFYNYGQSQSIDDILGLSADTGIYAKEGGLMSTALMAAGGTTGTRYGQYAAGGLPSNLVPHSGKMRVDFRKGDAVTGAGDGQSDDIPAMLADGEFVFPADVVAAIGNGSTKAGSDKLYDMMHGIRSHVRSAKPQDLPPEIKSPLDFLKTKRKKARS
jgi:hypothetical protein